MTGWRITRTHPTFDQDLAFSRLQRLHRDVAIVQRFRALLANREQHRVAPGQQLRRDEPQLPLRPVGGDDHLWLPARRRNRINPTSRVSDEEDVIVLSPARSEKEPGIAKRHRNPARKSDLLQLVRLPES